MYYPSINWTAVWSNRPSHAFNGEVDEQSQNGMDQMELLESGDMVVVRHRKTTPHNDAKEDMEVRICTYAHVNIHVHVHVHCTCDQCSTL